MQLIETREQFSDLLASIRGASILTFDIETNGRNLWKDHHMVGLALKVDDQPSCYLPFLHGVGAFNFEIHTKRFEEIDRQYNNLPLDWLKELVEVWGIPPIHLAHNGMFDLSGLEKFNFPLPKVLLDTQILARQAIPAIHNGHFKMPDTKKSERGQYALKWLGRLLGLVTLNDGVVGEQEALKVAMANLHNEMLEVGKTKKFHRQKAISYLWAYYPEEVAPYACMDVDLTYEIYRQLKDKLSAWGEEVWQLAELYCDHQLHVAYRMFKTGFKLNAAKCLSALAEAQVQETKKLKALHDLVGYNINPNSPQQVMKFFGTDSSSSETLLELDDNMAAKLIIEVRQIRKDIGTYIKKWLDTRGIGNKVHPFIHIIGAKTSRATSSGVAGGFQNIPRHHNRTTSPKSVLLPNYRDWQIFELDYSSLEMYLGAYVSETWLDFQGPFVLTDLILTGADMHTYTTEEIGIADIILDPYIRTGMTKEAAIKSWSTANYTEVDEFNKEMRYIGKTTNFAMMYGGGATALMRQLPMLNRVDASKIRDGWKRAYPAIENAINHFSDQALQFRNFDGSPGGPYQFVKYPIVPYIRKYNYIPSQFKEAEARNAFNSVVQGIGAFVTVHSAYRIAKAFPDIDLHVTVHDSIVGSCPPDRLWEVINHSKELMTDYPVYPELKVDVEVANPGESWGDKKPV